MALEAFEIKPITYRQAMDVIVANHYLHRKCASSNAFGLFHNETLKGVICYGTPSSAPLRKALAGPENELNVCELMRLWVCDSVPRNGESYLIGNTLKHCGKEIVVSYAEVAQGHLGVVYQATNWLYTGLSARRRQFKIEGVTTHCQRLADVHSAAELREKYGDRFGYEWRPPKHRYVWINAKGKRRQELLSKIKYPIQPYPKSTASTQAQAAQGQLLTP
jgi:hypothetical protein